MKLLDPWQVGDLITARKLNGPVEEHNAALRRADPPRAKPFIATPEGVEVRPFFLVHEDRDWVGALSHTVDEGLIKIAKPFKLRWYPFDGLTIDGMHYTYSGAGTGITRVKRRVSDGLEEIHQITEPYHINSPGVVIQREPIWAVRTDTKMSRPAEGVPPPIVLWQDQNYDARAWASVDTSR